MTDAYLHNLRLNLRRRFGVRQHSQRAVYRYGLICAFLLSSALFLFSVRLHAGSEKLVLRAELGQHHATPRKSEDKSTTIIKATPDLHHLPGAEFVLDKIDPSAVTSTSVERRLRLTEIHHQNMTEGYTALRKKVPSSPSSRLSPGLTLNGTQLALAYHRHTTRPRRWFSCKKLINADPVEQARYRAWIGSPAVGNKSRRFKTLTYDLVPAIMSDCATFKSIRGYVTSVNRKEDDAYPVAHVILVHRNFEQLERLVRSLYRPEHIFCIHVDAKVSERLKKAVSSFAECFENVHLAPSPQSIVYAHVSRLLADIVCMQELLRLDKTWQYLINYAASEFPMRTNSEMVQILQALHGVNDIHETFKYRQVSRFDKEYKIIDGNLKATHTLLPPAPYNITVVKGQAYNTYSRQFLQWVFSDPQAQALLTWSKQTYSPDEHFWGTLNNLYHNPHLHAPGGFTGDPEKKGYLTKFIIWAYKNAKFKCYGWPVHNICNLSALDLPAIVSQHHLAANKFNLNLDPVGYACMEELLENRTAAPDPKFNINKYKSMYFVKLNSKL